MYFGEFKVSSRGKITFNEYFQQVTWWLQTGGVIYGLMKVISFKLDESLKLRFLNIFAGFATLYEYYLVSLIYDSDRLMDTFILNALQPALEIDGQLNIRPMTYYVQEPDDIGDLFDWIAYEKGESMERFNSI